MNARLSCKMDDDVNLEIALPKVAIQRVFLTNVKAIKREIRLMAKLCQSPFL
jgi:hypothetical protein